MPQGIRRILTFPGALCLATHLIGSANDDLLDHCLHGPFVLNKPPSQVIEQIRMSRSLPQNPEVIGGRDDTTAEQVVPQTINQYAGDKRITFGIGDLIG